MFKRLKSVAGDPDLRPFELYVLTKIFGADWVINMRLLSEVRRDYENVFPPIRDQLYRMMVRDGLFPASPGSVRKGWMLAGALTAISATLLPTFAPAWLGRYDPMLRIGVVASGLIFIGWAWFMPRKTWAGVQVLAQVRGFQEFLARAEKDRLERGAPHPLPPRLPWGDALGGCERRSFNLHGPKGAGPATGK